MALEWLLGATGISAPIVGVSKLERLDDAIAALTMSLSPEDVAELEAPCVPHAVAG